MIKTSKLTRTMSESESAESEVSKPVTGGPVTQVNFSRRRPRGTSMIGLQAVNI